MSITFCDVCGSQSHPGEPCRPERVRQRIATFLDHADRAERSLDNARNAVQKLLAELPSLEGEKVEVEARWLRDLWSATGIDWLDLPYDTGSADNFHATWARVKLVLLRAMSLFASKGSSTPRLEKLRALKDACVGAAALLRYGNVKLDIEPEDILSEESSR